MKKTKQKFSSLFLLSIMMIALFAQGAFAASSSLTSDRGSILSETDDSTKKIKTTTTPGERVVFSGVVPEDPEDDSGSDGDFIEAESTTLPVIAGWFAEEIPTTDITEIINPGFAISDDGTKMVLIEDRNPRDPKRVISLDIGPYGSSSTEIIGEGFDISAPQTNQDGSIIAFKGRHTLTDRTDVYVKLYGVAAWLSLAPEDNTLIDFQLSGNGLHLVYESESNTGLTPNEITLLRINGHRKFALGSGRNPSINLDASKIAFVRDVSGVSQLFINNGEDSGERQLTTGVKNAESPSISADGSKIAFVYDSEIYTINSDGSNLFKVSQTISEDSTVEHSDALITSDGSKVIFKKAYLTSSLPEYELFMVDIDGSNLRSIISRETLLDYLVPHFDTDASASKVIVTIKAKVGRSRLRYFVIEPEDYSAVLTFESASAVTGSVRIPVNLETSENLGSMNMVLRYDSSVLTATEISKGSLTTDSLVESNIEDGLINVGIVDVGGFTGEGSVVYVEFEVEATETGTTSALHIEQVIGNLVDGTASLIRTVNGIFRFEERKGDCNHDNMITSIDALIALQMSVGRVPSESVADMNEDGSVTAYDALEILRLATESR